MKKSIVAGIGIAAVAIGITVAQESLAEDRATPTAEARGDAPSVTLENLLTAELERVENTEVIVSRVVIPPNTALPKHWHPGEEFAYVIAGSAVLWQEGEEDTTVNAGDALSVPLKQVHTAFTGDEGATILVFRVHEKGQPERIPAE